MPNAIKGIQEVGTVFSIGVGRSDGGQRCRHFIERPLNGPDANGYYYYADPSTLWDKARIDEAALKGEKGYEYGQYINMDKRTCFDGMNTTQLRMIASDKSKSFIIPNFDGVRPIMNKHRGTKSEPTFLPISARNFDMSRNFRNF